MLTIQTAMRFVQVTCALCLVAAPSNQPSINAKSGVEAQTRYCKSVWEYTQTNPPHRFFAEIENPSEEPGENTKWQEFATKEDMEKDENHYTAAFVWLREGRVVAANFTISDGSQDWFQYADYCFDSRGRLAGIQEELRSFYGMIVARRRYSYDGKGKLLDKSETFMDLDNQKPKRPDEEFIDRELPTYLRVRKLPFASLLGKKRRSGH
ncbi:MAG: hypothetical protein JSS69_07505 [Acidobacteria bacterium]|nr:hypothetical protein [Acidobacteriota bacterium]MBS1865749.1 hypothetical protein [Acidobacteriota bacterium]